MPHGLGNHLGQTAYMAAEAVAAFANVVGIVSSTNQEGDRARGRRDYGRSDLKALRDAFAVIIGGTAQGL